MGSPCYSILSVDGNAIKPLSIQSEVGCTEPRGWVWAGTPSSRNCATLGKTVKSAHLNLIFDSCPMADVQHRVW